MHHDVCSEMLGLLQRSHLCTFINTAKLAKFRQALQTEYAHSPAVERWAAGCRQSGRRPAGPLPCLRRRRVRSHHAVAAPAPPAACRARRRPASTGRPARHRRGRAPCRRHGHPELLGPHRRRQMDVADVQAAAVPDQAQVLAAAGGQAAEAANLFRVPCMHHIAGHIADAVLSHDNPDGDVQVGQLSCV